MERSNRIAQAYGYAVCFIAVITLLFSTKGIIDAAFDLRSLVSNLLMVVIALGLFFMHWRWLRQESAAG